MCKIISVFDKSNNNLLFEQEIGVDISILKRIFNAYSDDPELIMVYPINKAIANELSKYLNFQFDFEKYIYELGTYTIL